MPAYTIWNADGSIACSGRNHPHPENIALAEGQTLDLSGAYQDDRYRYVDGQPVALAPAPTAIDVINEMTRRLELPFAWNGNNFQVDERSQQRITSMGALAATVADKQDTKWLDHENDFFWIGFDNSHVTMTAADMLAFAQSAALWVSGHILAASALKSSPDGIPEDYASDERWPTNA
jgi:hypothetical protein